MAFVQHAIRGEEFLLGAQNLVGRAPHCTWRLSDARVSSEHARIRWTGAGWEIKDLSSSNGTWVNGEQIKAGIAVGLPQGALLSFGHNDQSWTLADVGPPAACARNLSSGAVSTSVDGLIAVPSEDEPRLSILEEGHDRWCLEDVNGKRSVEHGEVLVVDGESWRLELATGPEPTWTRDLTTQRLGDYNLELSVSSDEEHVEATLVRRNERVAAEPSVHYYILLLLARRLLTDTQDDLSQAEQGWIYRDELCDMLRTDPNKLNVDIYRVRRLFGKLGIQGAAGIIERRPTTRQLRVGLPRIKIVAL